MRAIYLVGFMGAGKSSVAKELAKAYSLPVYDTDREIEKAAGMSVTEIFALKGEVYFREMETAALKKIPKENVVVATGGGVILAEANRRLMMQEGMVIFLYADPVEILTRLEGDSTRPLLQGDKRMAVQSLYNSRLPLYKQAAHHEIDTTSQSIQEIVNEIRQRMKR